jgi:FtsH-binding integral membrane protein
MFSGLPKLADKAFVIGFLVPVLITLFELLLAFQECAWLVTTARTLESASDLGKLSLLAAAVILAALFLLLINRPIYRALEGYTGPFSARPFKRLAAWAGRRRDAKEALLRKAHNEAPAGKAEDANVALRRYLRRARSRYPRKDSLLLPTSFGNANRAFERYPADVYGVEAILIWPRLEATLPKSLQTALSDARAQVNCFMNIAVLSGLVAAARLLGWLGEGIWRAIVGAATAFGTISLTSFLIGSVGLGLLAALTWLSYQMAVERVFALGAQVKVAFDLYLPQLPARLGYTMPDDPAGRSSFWERLEEAFDFQNPVEGISWVASTSPPPDAAAALVSIADEADDADDGAADNDKDGDDDEDAKHG